MENSLDCGFSNTSVCVIKEFSQRFINAKENTTAILVQSLNHIYTLLFNVRYSLYQASSVQTMRSDGLALLKQRANNDVLSGNNRNKVLHANS